MAVRLPKIHIPVGGGAKVAKAAAKVTPKVRKAPIRKGYNRKIYDSLREGLGTFSKDERNILNEYMDELISESTDFSIEDSPFDYESLYNRLLENDSELLNSKKAELQARIEANFENKVQNKIYDFVGTKYGGTEAEDVILQKAKYQVLSDGYTKGKIDYRKIDKNLNDTAYIEQISTNSRGEGLRDRIVKVQEFEKRKNMPKPGDENFIGPSEAPKIPNSYYRDVDNFLEATRDEIDLAYQKGGDEFISNLATRTMDDNFLPLQMDASDDVLNAVYDRVNKESWQRRYVEKQYNSGVYKKHGYAAETFEDLTEDQQKRLMDNIQEQVSSFNEIYTDSVPVLDANGNPVINVEKRRFHRAKKTPEMTQEFSAQHARQEFIKRKLGYDPTDSMFDSYIDEKIETLGKDTRQAKELDAYRSYASKTYNEAQTTKLQTAEDFLSERGLTKKEISKMKVKNLGTASELVAPTDKSGIGLWGTIKKHPVAALAVTMTTAWGISEMNEID